MFVNILYTVGDLATTSHNENQNAEKNAPSFKG